jgi:hypothetical protein
MFVRQIPHHRLPGTTSELHDLQLAMTASFLDLRMWTKQPMG